MDRPTRGQVLVRSEHDGARLGVCPQRDVLFEYMSAREHVALYAQLKSGRAHVHEEVDRWVTSLLHTALPHDEKCHIFHRLYKGFLVFTLQQSSHQNRVSHFEDYS